MMEAKQTNNNTNDAGRKFWFAFYTERAVDCAERGYEAGRNEYQEWANECRTTLDRAGAMECGCRR